LIEINEIDKTEDLYRNNYDLCVKQYISIYDCMTGGTFRHKHHITDDEIVIKLNKICDEQGVIKKEMLKQKIKSLGFYNGDDNKGDLVIEVCIVCPEMCDVLKQLCGESLKNEETKFVATIETT
jgi:hypothetical protein